jgi:excisionase family DNA binding protein
VNDDNIERIFTDDRANEAGMTESDEMTDTFDNIQWLSTQDAAERLGITPRTLYRFIDQGDLPAYRFGRVIRLRTKEVDAFIRASRIKPGELEHLYPEPVARESQS